MRGLYHSFYLVSLDEAHYDEYWYGHGREGGIHIHHDYLSTLQNEIAWLPTYNPAMKVEWQGLCWTGPTVIRLKGARIATKVFAAWAALISNGPGHLKLRGSYAVRSNGSGYFTRVEINRDEFIAQLLNLGDYAEQVIRSNEHQFILHMGL